MSGNLQTLDRRLLARRCVACGYDGDLLRGGHASQCARCGCNLRDRPARSYAEMEGLLGQTETVEPTPDGEPAERSLNHRWITFVCVFVLFMLVLVYLSLSALPLT